MKPLLLIYNPNAGKGAIAGHLNEIIQIFTAHHWLCSCWPTRKKGDGKKIVTELGSKFARIVCAGGDGTLSEIAEGLLSLESPPPLAYIPFGSTNDSANTLHLPKDPLNAAKIAATGIPLKQDSGSLNGQPFLYVAAFGAFSAVSYEVSQDWKNMFGSLAYVMGGMVSLPSITPYHIKVCYDGKEIEDDFFYGMVCNSYTVGGLTALSEDTVFLDDGEFEVLLIRKADGFHAIFAALQSFLWKIPIEDSSVLTFRAKELSFHCTIPLAWTIDGEYGGTGHDHRVVNHRHSLTVIHGENLYS
ncbi:MAG: YegS/Rv2252/BmrU family lipid kinase [Eubacteriales bacterium]